MRIAAESLMPRVRVADVARRHEVTQVHDWRRRLRDDRLALRESVMAAPAFAALVIEEPLRPVGGCLPDARRWPCQTGGGAGHD